MRHQPEKKQQLKWQSFEQVRQPLAGIPLISKHTYIFVFCSIIGLVDVLNNDFSAWTGWPPSIFGKRVRRYLFMKKKSQIFPPYLKILLF